MLMLLSALMVLMFACVHIFASRISFLNTLPRRKWLSLAGGISIAFVFLHLLPELNSMQESLSDDKLLPVFFTNDLYVIAMAGILLFYGLEQLIIYYYEQHSESRKSVADKTIFWSHIGMFALFNCIIGYYLHHELQIEDFSSFLTLTAFGFHSLVIDYSLLRHHDQMYHHTGRWVMTAAVLTGWGFGTILTLPENFLYVLFSLLAGAIVVNSFKEELPKEKESNYIFFLIGTVIYTVLWIL